MKTLSALGGGATGAAALTLLHETVKRINPNAPRMDLLGMYALSKTLRNMRMKTPHQKQLFLWTMAGDLLANSIYYMLIGAGGRKNIWAKAISLGLVAGLGGVLLPKHLGLNDAPSNRTPQTKLMTVAWYLVGALVAAAAIKRLASNEKKYAY